MMVGGKLPSSCNADGIAGINANWRWVGDGWLIGWLAGWLVGWQGLDCGQAWPGQWEAETVFTKPAAGETECRESREQVE